MRPNFKFILSFLFLLWTGLAFNIITWLFVLFKIKPNSEILPLHYNVFYGTDFSGKGYYIYIIPAIGLSIWLFNYFFYRLAKNRDPFASKLLVSISFIVQVFVLIALIFLKSEIVI